MSDIATHPDAAALSGFANGRLDDDHRAEVEAHVAACDECCAALERVAGDSLVDLARIAAGGMATPSPGEQETVSPCPEVPAGLADHPRYKILGRLGAGGMGVVYKAEHRMMGRTVAVKLLHPEATGGAGAVERFRREVRVASKVAHPNVVTAFDADEADGRQFLVMEYVDGLSLDRLVARRGPLAVPMACQFARLAALALQHAHEHGMVHRDVKPQNMMVTRKGQLKVLDFGLARAVRPPDGGPAGADGGLTNPNLVVGTPDYLSPEQAKNSATVDIRSDVYSLGCTLYFMLTGRTPFSGDSPLEKMIAHVNDDVPDLSAVRADVPPALAGLVARMMAKAPGDRPASPAEAAAELTPFARPVGPAGPAVRNSAAATPRTAVRPIVPAPVRSAVVVPAETPTPARRAKTKSVRRPRRPAESFLSRHRAWIAAGLAVLIVGPLLAVGVHRLTRSTPVDAGADPDGSVAGADDDRPAPPPPAGFAGPPTGQVRVLLVLPPENVWLPDVDALRKEFETENRVTLETASVTAGPIAPHPASPPPRGDTPASHALADVRPDDYAAVVFIGEGVSEYLPGGAAADDVRRIIDGFVARGKPVAAVCVGTKVLGEHGYLDGRDAARVDPKLYDRAGINWLTTLPPVVISPPYLTAGADVHANDLAAVLMATLGVRSPGTPPKTGPRYARLGPGPGGHDPTAPPPPAGRTTTRSGRGSPGPKGRTAVIARVASVTPRPGMRPGPRLQGQPGPPPQG